MYVWIHQKQSLKENIQLAWYGQKTLKEIFTVMGNYSVNIVYIICICLLPTYKVIDDAGGWSQSMAPWAINHSLPSSLQPGKWPFSRGLWVHTALRRVCNWLMRKPHLRVGRRARKDTVSRLASSLGLSPVEYDIQCQVWLKGKVTCSSGGLLVTKHANNPFSAEQPAWFSKIFRQIMSYFLKTVLCLPTLLRILNSLPPLASFSIQTLFIQTVIELLNWFPVVWQNN